jgi:uncharacterized protein (TIRG00374 family)
MKWHVVLGIVISTIFVVLICAWIDFNQLATALQSAHYLFLVSAALALVSTHVIRAWRWRYLLEPVKPVRILPLLSATSIGYLANMLLPAHAGEIMRAYLISRKEQVSTMASLATIVVERVADLVCLLLVLMYVLMFANLSLEMIAIAQGLRIGGYVATLLCLVLIGSLWFVKARTAMAIRLISGCMVFLPHRWCKRLIVALQSFALGLQAIKTGWHLVAILGLSLLLWSVIALSNLLMFHAFNLHLPLFAAFFILVVQVLGAMIPSSPGFIGTYHAAVVAGLAVFEVTQELAFGVAIMMHAAFFFPFILVGLIFLWGESLTLRELRVVSAQKPRG